jgi:hypothetical protein
MYLKPWEVVHARQHCSAFLARGVEIMLFSAGMGEVSGERCRIVAARNEVPDTFRCWGPGSS